MGEQDLIDLLLKNIQFQLRHPNYDRTIKVRDFSTMATTDEGQENEVERYRRFETDDLKKQRNRLYNSFTGSIISSLRKNWQRLARVEGIRFRAESTNETGLTQLEKDYYNFLPGETITEWLHRVMELAQITDPNKWIIYERADTRNEDGTITNTKVYPFIIPAVDALNFSYSYGMLEWFLCRTVQMEYAAVNGARQRKLLENYYLYAPGYVVRAREIGENTVQEDGEFFMTLEIYPPDIAPMDYDDGKPQPFPVGGKTIRNYYIKVGQNGTTEVPAFIAGAYMDEATDHNTRVPWFWAGKGLLQDIIKLKSSLDVVLTVHTYPKRRDFVKGCTFSDPDHGECVGGYMNGVRDKDHVCPSCGGSGKAPGFTTEQEALQMILPEDPQLVFELSKLSFTEPIDITLPELLQKLLDRRSEQFVQAIFSSDSHQKPDASGAMTAFEVAKINEGVHDALTTYGKHFSKAVELAFRIGAQYREFDIAVDYSFPEDLQIESLYELINGFKQAKESGVGYEVLASMRKRIQQKTFEGDPVQQARVDARYYWMPFDDQSPDSIAMIISGRSPLDNEVVLYQNFKAIFQAVEEANPDFYKMSLEMQRTKLTAVVEQFKGNILLIDQTPTDQAGAGVDFNPNPNPAQ